MKQAAGRVLLWVYAVPATRSHGTSSPRHRASAACQTPGEIALLNCRQKCSKNFDIVFGNLIWKYCLRNFEGKSLIYLIQVYADSCAGFLCMHLSNMRSVRSKTYVFQTLQNWRLKQYWLLFFKCLTRKLFLPVGCASVPALRAQKAGPVFPTARPSLKMDPRAPATLATTTSTLCI